jgi:hypothetical protein
MDVIERLTVSWEDASFALVAALAWLSVSLVSCPQVRVRSFDRAGVEITAAIPSVGPMVVSVEDADREFQEDDIELCGLPGVELVSPASFTLSQVTPPENLSLSVVTPAHHPLRC